MLTVETPTKRVPNRKKTTQKIAAVTHAQPSI